MPDNDTHETLSLDRRQYLLSVGALGSLSITAAGESLINTPDEFNNREQAGNSVAPPYPDDPFMPGQFASGYLYPTDRRGWEEASIREEYRTLLGLHLDVFDSAGLAVFSNGELRPDEDTSRALSLSFRTGLPATAGRNTTIEPIRTDDLQPLLEEQNWEYPSGSRLKSVSGSYAETFSGDDQIIEFGFPPNGIPSAFAPLGLHLMKIVATKRLDQGFSGFFIDKVFNFDGLDFSEWARAAFREHIQSLPSSRQEELDIVDPSTFNVKEYLRRNNLTPNSGQDPREDPVFREYVIHNHLGIQSYLASLRNTLIEEFPDRFAQGDVAIWANQFTGTLYGPQQAVNVYGSPYFDVINTELFPTVNPAVDHKYKILQAVGNFEKPVIAKATLTPSLANDPELDPTNKYPNLERFQLAECHVNGARLKIPLSSRSTADKSITQWIRNDGSVPEPLQSLADFVWTHKRFLANSSPANPVAVVWSLPDRMYRRLPQWDIDGYDSQKGVDSFIGTTKLLRETQIPYTVLVFGHPDLWDDAKQLERLLDHEAVILPDIECLTDSQYSALEEYLAEDGFLIASGSLPERTGRYELRTDTDQLFSDENAVVLDENPALNREKDGQGGSQLQDAVVDAGVRSFAKRQDTTLSVNVRQQSQPSRTVVHLLNYDYSKQNDSFESKNNIEITLPSPDHEIGVARYYSEQETVNVTADSSGETVTFTVPQLTDWGFVVLAESKSDLVNTEDETAAENAVSSLREQTEAAREAGYDWSPTFTIAKTRLEEATTALDADAYAEALAAVKKGTSAVEKLDRQQPVIGIDLSHGQAASFNQENPFDQLKTNISYPEYREIDSWSHESLSELDILIIPPALSFSGENHGFTRTEIDEISRFVENGGSLVILARGGVAPDISALTGEFGYAFDGRGIKFPSDARPVAKKVNEHVLMQAVPVISASLATTIVELPEEATTLVSMPEDNEAWFHEEQPIDERAENEEDVPADPMYAVSNHGKGTVAVLGNWAYLHVPGGPTHWTPMMNNLFSTLSARAADALNGATETPSDTKTPTPTDEVETPTPPESATETTISTETVIPTGTNAESTPGETQVKTPSVAGQTDGESETSGAAGPGFGIWSGLTALAGVAHLLKNRLDEDTGPES